MRARHALHALSFSQKKDYNNLNKYMQNLKQNQTKLPQLQVFT